MINNLIKIISILKKLNVLTHQKIISNKEILEITDRLEQMKHQENKLFILYEKIKKIDSNNKNEFCELLLEIKTALGNYIHIYEEIQDDRIKKIIGRYGRYQSTKYY